MRTRALVALGVYGFAVAVGLGACSSNDQATAPDASASESDASASRDVAPTDGKAFADDATGTQDVASGDAGPSASDGMSGQLDAPADDVRSSPGDGGDANEAGRPNDGRAPGDAGGDSDAVTAHAPWILMVNVSPDFGAMYICLASQVATPNVLPSTLPLLPQNAGAALYYQAPPPYGAVDLTSLDVSLYAVSPQVAATASGTLAGGRAGCADLVASSQASLLGTIGAGTLQNSAAYLFAIAGCVANDDAGSSCGGNYDASSSNLGLHISQVDNTTAAFDAGIGVQFAQASTQWEAVALALSGSYGGTIGEVYDAGPPVLIGTGGLDAGVVPSTAVVTREFENPNATLLTVALQADGGSTSLGMLSGISIIQALTFGIDDAGVPNSPPGGFLTRGNWTFVLVGDPNQEAFVDGGYNPLVAHVIGLPNQP